MGGFLSRSVGWVVDCFLRRKGSSSSSVQTEQGVGLVIERGVTVLPFG